MRVGVLLLLQSRPPEAVRQSLDPEDLGSPEEAGQAILSDVDLASIDISKKKEHKLMTFCVSG